MSRRLINLGTYSPPLPDIEYGLGTHDLVSDGRVHVVAAVGPDDHETSASALEPLVAGISQVRDARGVAPPLPLEDVRKMVVEGLPEDAEQLGGLPGPLRDLGSYALCAISSPRTVSAAPRLQVLGYGVLMHAADIDVLVVPEIAFRREITEHDSYSVMLAILLKSMLEDAKVRHGIDPETLIVGSEAPSREGWRRMQALGFDWNANTATFTALTTRLRPKVNVLVESIGPNATES